MLLGRGRNTERERWKFVAKWMCERCSMVEGFVSIFITIGRIYRLNNGCVMELGLPPRQEINVVVAFLHAGNYRQCFLFFFQEAACKKKALESFVCPYGRWYIYSLELWRSGRMSCPQQPKETLLAKLNVAKNKTKGGKLIHSGWPHWLF